MRFRIGNVNSEDRQQVAIDGGEGIRLTDNAATGVITLTAPADRAQLALTARGLVSSAFDPTLNPTGLAPTSQQIYGTILGLRAGDVVTNIVTNVAQAATGGNPTNIYLGLFSVAGARLALTADLAASANWTSVGYKESALATPYTVPSDGGYYPVFLMNGAFGGTALQLNRGANSTAPAGAVGSNSLFAVTQTGQASLPANATFVATSLPVWVGIS